MKSSDYKSLIVWQKSIDLVVCVYEVIKMLPPEEKFGLCDQMRRCVISIPSNIAEGVSRGSIKETLHFLSISRGSIAELETQLIISKELDYITNEIFESLSYKLKGISVMLVSFMSKLSNLTAQYQQPKTLKT